MRVNLGNVRGKKGLGALKISGKNVILHPEPAAQHAKWLGINPDNRV